jgi:hypothetical protein
MDTVPLDLQRKCEQRWVARYRRLAEPAANPKHRVEEQHQQPAMPSKGRRKAPRPNSTGSKYAPAA